MTSWLVIENTPGYMPDSEPAAFAAKRDAVAHARSLGRELREEGYRLVSYGDFGFGATWLYERNSEDLGRNIEVSRLDE